jgi:hypothetical protein
MLAFGDLLLSICHCQLPDVHSTRSRAKLDWPHHTGSLLVCQDAYERHEIVLESVICVIRASATLFEGT